MANSYDYGLICGHRKGCGFVIEKPQDSDYRIDEDGNRHFPFCPECGELMKNNTTGCNGDYYHVSETLGINPEQVAEHKKRWPNVEVLPGGQLGFHSVKEQQRYANHFGLDKAPQKSRR